MANEIGPVKTPESAQLPASEKSSSAPKALMPQRESIEYGASSENSSKGCFEWIKSLFCSLFAFFRELFASSEQVPHSEFQEEKEEKGPIIRTDQTNQDHVTAIRKAISESDFSTAASHFSSMTDPLAQLQFIKQLMKEDYAPIGYINGLVNLYAGKQLIFDRMKQVLETHDLSMLTDQTNASKETYLQMSNAVLFGKFPKSNIARIAVSGLIEEMTRP